MNAWECLFWREWDELLSLIQEELREQMTSTEELKRRVRDIYKLSEITPELRGCLIDDKTLLLCRGYEVGLGPRGGATFKYVGYVADDDPRWQNVEKW